MPTSPLRLAASYVLVSLLVVLGAVPLLSTAPARAAVTRTIDITADGPKPASVTAAVGDTIAFRNADPTFVHQVASESTNWDFRSPPLAPGQVFTVPAKLAKAGDHLYQGVNLDSFKGKVVVPGTTASPRSSPTRSAAAPPPASPAPRPSSDSPAPAATPTGGSGSAGAPPITGGFGAGGFPSAAPSPGGPAPNVAPVLPGEALPSAQPTGPVVAAAPGRLPEPSTARRYGLPAALAAVAAAGVASLLVRLLLAHPAARHARRTGSGPAVTVD